MRKFYVSRFFNVAGNSPEECAKKIAQKKKDEWDIPCKLMGVAKVSEDSYRGIFYHEESEYIACNVITVYEL